MMNGSRSDSVLRGHDGVDEDDGEDQHQSQLSECLRLLLGFRTKADREVLWNAHFPETGGDGAERLAQRRFRFGADANDPLLILPLDFGWS